MKLDRETLLRILPRVPKGHVDDYLERNNDAMLEACVHTPERVAMWLAQVGHESGEFRWLEELGDGSAYEGRKDLGNVKPGDGRLYKGRGVIQLTGRANYEAFSRAMDCDFVAMPELVARPHWAFRAAGWFWSRHNLNALADKRDLRAVTKRINGGFNGLEHRRRIYELALLVLEDVAMGGA